MYSYDAIIHGYYIMNRKTEVVYASINATNNDYEDSRAIKTCHIQ